MHEHGFTGSVEVFGTFAAEMEGGKVSRLSFTPYAGDAGYFGPAGVILRGDDALDVEDTDGPFWRAMQAALAGVTRNGDAGHAVQIEWTE